MKWKTAMTFAHARVKVQHTDLDGVLVCHLHYEKRSGPLLPWKPNGDEYFVDGTKKDFRCQSEGEVPGMVARYLKSKNSK
ncbi:MAG: hypothetical protein ABI432_08715 [Flavobacteriales bacterium]